MPNTRSAAPIFAAILLLLPVLYVGSYPALVQPASLHSTTTDQLGDPSYCLAFYRYGGERSRRFFWPLEQIDRKVRPEAWGIEPDLET
ncbi:hypothetical protein ETAA8_27180 [Anatilimnocola aggregata]|uniref:Uncharacterized protein n=1 Tax=Anatilimnocola aggregata TaxID=2528021 RepID=A0A517YBK4_9BACT|nr:hypothetical protein [Anatilimnocola aggregata]QDU27630.1 hypothetical protein ETAA8_27180 [Anatilimnocola aggregata]